MWKKIYTSKLEEYYRVISSANQLLASGHPTVSGSLQVNWKRERNYLRLASGHPTVGPIIVEVRVRQRSNTCHPTVNGKCQKSGKRFTQVKMHRII